MAMAEGKITQIIGAVVDVAFPRESIPNRLYFLELKSGAAYEADVVWRRSPQFGLRFVRRIDLENPPRELRGLERVRGALRP